MQDLIDTIRQHFDTGSYDSEEAVRAQICYPILRELGWKAHSPVDLIPEYKIKKLRVDIALCLQPSKPAIFIEVKAPGKCSSEGQEQVFEYAARQGGIPMIVFTDGNEWHFYNSYGVGNYESRKARIIRLAKDDPNDCITGFHRYLQYEEVKTERAFENLRSDYNRNRRADEARLKIPEAWSLLVDDMDEMLVEIIVEKVKEVSSGQHVPEKKDVTEFLKGLKPEGANRGSNVLAPGPKTPRTPRGTPISPGRVCRCKIKGEVTKGNGKQVYMRALDYVIAGYGRVEELERQKFNKLKARAGVAGYHIAREEDQIPKEREHKERLAQSRIWVNKNLGRASLSEKLDQIANFYNGVERRKILGRWGSGAEVEFDFGVLPASPRRETG